jgi:tetratricopeptide (TPR) repeat protein
MENKNIDEELERHIATAFERKGERDALKELEGVDSEARLRKILSLAEGKYTRKAARPAALRWWSVAAAVAVIAVAVIGLQPRYSTEELFAAAYERPVYDPAVSRGGEEVPVEMKPLIDRAGELYEAGNMQEAATIYDSAAALGGLPDEALFYHAVALAETGRENDAETIFLSIAADPVSEYTEDAAWQSALLYVQLGKRTEARHALESIAAGNGKYVSKANDLLALLKQKRWF